jgi:hypothetical protein
MARKKKQKPAEEVKPAEPAETKPAEEAEPETPA